jgi:hypothetical protein
VLESARTRERRRSAREAKEPSLEHGLAFRTERRQANQRKAASLPAKKAQDLVELACECLNGGCERSVRVPLYVYRRMLEAGNQYLLQTGHHASPRYRTIVTFGTMTIEEQI